MEPRISRAVDEFMRVRKNPTENLVSEFKTHLLKKGILEPSENDLVEAALAVGIPEEELIDFVEEFASRL
jgi:hypothetical protein